MGTRQEEEDIQLGVEGSQLGVEDTRLGKEGSQLGVEGIQREVGQGRGEGHPLQNLLAM